MWYFPASRMMSFGPQGELSSMEIVDGGVLEQWVFCDRDGSGFSVDKILYG